MIKLSASKLQTLNSCSFLYYVNYFLKIRGPGNDGSNRGNVCHTVFQELLTDKRKSYVKKILSAKSIEVVPSVLRLVKKHMKNYQMEEFDNKGNHNYNLINEMIVTGLSLDFFCSKDIKKGGVLQASEKEFLYESPHGYIINGFIDKLIEIDGRIKLYDYKSSQNKYEGDEGSIQGLMYSLWAYRVKKVMSCIRFIFLRFPDDPYVDKEFTKEELEGFEQYLADVTKKLEKFTFRDAISNMAADKGWPEKGEGFCKKAMCGRSQYPGHLKKDGNVMWSCFCKHPFKYYGVYDKDGQYLYGSIEKPILKEGECMLQEEYNGCYRFYPENYKSIS